MLTQSVRAIPGTLVFFAFYISLSAWLASAGNVITANLLTSQIVAYSAIALAALLMIWAFKVRSPWATYQGKSWPALLAVSCAIVTIITRFFLKQPPASWSAKGGQEWRDIIDGYIVGRLLVPCAEELVFRGFLFGVLEKFARWRAPLTVVVTAVVFAGLHWPPLYGLSDTGGSLEVISALAAGLAFGGLRAWTGSILPGLGLHAIGNSIGF